MSTEMPLPREIRQSIREKLGSMPTLDSATVEHVARMAAEADWTDVAGTVEPSAHAGMRPNPLQGGSGTTGLAPAAAARSGHGTALERIRDEAARHNATDSGVMPR